MSELQRPFKRLTVEQHFHLLTKQVVLVSWVMNPGFRAPGPYRFTIQRGRAANDDNWVDVASTEDQPWAFDRTLKQLPHDFSLFYRVRLVDGKKQEYLSHPVSAESDWSHYDWRLVREILRKEELLYRKRAGAEGWLLKRRLWGYPCDLCTDPNTGAVRDSHCPKCYGTGVVGGYYDALPFRVLIEPSQRMKRLTGEQGLVTSVINTARAPAWPEPDANDIWVNRKTNRRCRIAGDIAQIANHRGVPLILNLRLEELPATDKIYDFPTPSDFYPASP